MKKYLFLLILPILFLLPKDTFAQSVTLGTPVFYQHYISPETTTNGQAIIMGWWGSNNYYYSGAYLGNPGSTGNISDRVNYIWQNSNLCAGENLTIKGTIGGLTGFFTSVANRIVIYNNGEKLSCTFSYDQNGSRATYSCAGKGGGSLDIYVFEDSFLNGRLYEVGVSREVDITCDSSNTDIIIADKENTNAIINNNNTNTDKIIESNEEVKDAITSEDAPDLDALDDSAGWLPSGPVDSIINLPLSLFQNLTDNLSKSCQPVIVELPYVNKNITLPCVSTLYEQIGVQTFLNWVGIVVGALILYNYFLKLYQWVDDTLTFRENNWQDWGGV